MKTNQSISVGTPQIGVQLKSEKEVSKEELELLSSMQEENKKFFGQLFDFISGGAFSKQIQNYQYEIWKNKIKIASKAKNLLQKIEINKDYKPTLKVLGEITEKSKFEEEESLQNKWAAMLANALSGKLEVKVSYPKMLNELSSLEVSLLDKIYSEIVNISDYEKRRNTQFGREAICKMANITIEQGDLMIENLIRLGICETPGSTGVMFGSARVALKTTEVFELTTFGFHFIKSCKFENK